MGVMKAVKTAVKPGDGDFSYGIKNGFEISFSGIDKE